MIALHVEPIACALDAERVLKLPKFVRSRAATYWHVPRSAERRRDGRLSVMCWCGVSFHGKRPILLTDEEPDENVCGTCVGRWEGFTATIGGRVFRPRDVFAVPTWCPSTESDDRGDCIACGHRIIVRWYGGISRHKPDARFVDRCRPCPDHGWRNAVARGGRVLCRVFVGCGWDYCDFDCGPEAGR